MVLALDSDVFPVDYSLWPPRPVAPSLPVTVVWGVPQCETSFPITNECQWKVPREEWDPRLQHGILLRRGTRNWAVAPSIPCLHLVTLKKAELSAIGDIYLHMGLLLLYYRLLDFQEESSTASQCIEWNFQKWHILQGTIKIGIWFPVFCWSATLFPSEIICC